MAESQFRIWAKAVAILELVFTSLTSVLLILLGIGVVFMGAEAINRKRTFKEEQSSGSRETTADGFGDTTIALTGIIFGIAILIIIGILAVYMWFSYNLLKAATIGTEPSEALRRASRWRIFAIVMLVISLLSLFRMQCLIGTIVGLLFRILFIYVVHRYIKDLEVTVHENFKPPQYGQMA